MQTTCYSQEKLLMPLDLQAQVLLEQLAMLEEFYEPSLEEIRRRSNASSALMSGLEPVGSIENRSLAGPGGALPVRIYTPKGHGPFPILVYLHGGGWIVGNLDMVEPICRSLTNTALCIVISVDYRLAPEHKFPAAVEDAFAATQWAANNASNFNGDPGRLAVGGDSAGGNLAAVVAQMARDQQGPTLVYQLLLYPSTDHSAALDTTKTGFAYTMNTLERVQFHSECYLNSWEDASNPQASPLLAGNFANLPPTLLVTTEYDFLHEQGKCYAERLQAAGADVTYKHYHDMMHGFISMAAFLDKGKQALTEIGTTLYHAFYADH
jgi:acetyl esterase